MKRNLIVNFHKVNDTSWFESVILLLKSKYTLVDLKFFENSENYEKKKGFCHITFDDGDNTFYTVAFPILKKHNLPVTIFVSPNSIINQENFWFQEIEDYDENIMTNILSRELSLTLEKIKKIHFLNILKCLPLDRIKEIITIYQKETNTPPKPCQNMNLDKILEVEKYELMTVGAHTMNHAILKNENDENSYNEISRSIIELQNLLGHEIRYFAYPNGIPNIDFGEREINYLLKNNIAIALSTEEKFISSHDNKLAFPRFGIDYVSILLVKAKLILGANWELIKSLKHHFKLKSRQIIASKFEESKNKD